MVNENSCLIVFKKSQTKSKMIGRKHFHRSRRTCLFLRIDRIVEKSDASIIWTSDVIHRSLRFILLHERKLTNLNLRRMTSNVQIMFTSFFCLLYAVSIFYKIDVAVATCWMLNEDITYQCSSYFTLE